MEGLSVNHHSTCKVLYGGTKWASIKSCSTPELVSIISH